MNGREHYLEAERLAVIAARHMTEDPRDMRIAEVAAWRAQVHATLALSAVTTGRRMDWEQCGSCDGSGYAPPIPPQAAS